MIVAPPRIFLIFCYGSLVFIGSSSLSMYGKSWGEHFMWFAKHSGGHVLTVIEGGLVVGVAGPLSRKFLGMFVRGIDVDQMEADRINTSIRAARLEHGYLTQALGSKAGIQQEFQKRAVDLHERTCAVVKELETRTKQKQREREETDSIEEREEIDKEIDLLKKRKLLLLRVGIN